MTRHTRRRRTTAFVLLLAGVFALAVTGLWLTYPGRENTPGPRDMNGQPVQFDDDAPSQPAGAFDAGQGRFQVPSVGLDVPLGRMYAVGNQVTPPGFTSAYQITGLGVPLAHASTGTVYVAMHSLRGHGLGPGNYLFNVNNGTASVALGARINAGGVTYTVDGWQAIDKNRLPASGIWADVPGRLVVITCLARLDNTPATENFIVTAHQSPSPHHLLKRGVSWR